MKYFLDTEFIEGFHKPFLGKRRHFIDLISIGIVAEDGRKYYAISNEYRYKDADPWVQENVILPMYLDRVHGDARNRWSVNNFNHAFGKSNEHIKLDILEFTGCWRDQHFYRTGHDIPEVYAYYADYDWVVFCSLFGRMIDLPKGFPMYCNDLKQTLDEKAVIFTDPEQRVQKSGSMYPQSMETKVKILKSHPGFPKQENEHSAIDDARWNKKLYEFLQTI